MAKQSERKFKAPTNQERLEEYFWQLEKMMPNPPKDWAKCSRPCKWDKILKERQEDSV